MNHDHKSDAAPMTASYVKVMVLEVVVLLLLWVLSRAFI